MNDVSKLLDIDMTYDAADMRNLQHKLGSLGGKANTIMSRAANRAAAKTKTVMKQQASKRYFITQKKVASVTFIKRATTASPTASVMAKDTHDNLYKFKVNPTRIARPKGENRKPPKVYTSQVRRSGIRKALSTVPKPFVAQMKNGTIGLFQRKSTKKKKRGIKAIFGPAIPQLLKKKEIMDKVEEEAGEVLLKRIEHEMDRVLKGGSR